MRFIWQFALIVSTTGFANQQVSQDVLCACGPSGVIDKSICPGRGFFNSSQHCKNCAGGASCLRLSEQSCGPQLHCATEFGLSCDSIQNICKGKIHVQVVNAAARTAQVQWKLRKKTLPPPGIFYSSKYDGDRTSWNGGHVNENGNSALLKNLKPQHEYAVKVIQDGSSEIAIFRTSDSTEPNKRQPKFLARSANSITIAWDDFDPTERYTIEYRSTEAGPYDPWITVKVSGNFGTVTNLLPGNGYSFRVKNQQGVTSDTLVLFTEDGCVRQNKNYLIGEEFFEGCDLRCVCRGSDQGDCEPRCPSPFIKAGTFASSKSQCHQVPSQNDTCCVAIHCEHGKPGKCPSTEHSLTNCPHECSTDGDCLGADKCCHSEVCGRSVCLQPLNEDAANECSDLTCGPNSFCLLQGGNRASCECLKGYSGDPNNAHSGCNQFTKGLAPVDPGVCTYRDKRYPVGEEFADACDFRCHCTDSFEVECHERCPKPPARIPVGCRLIADPKDSCCEILACERKDDTPHSNSPQRFQGCKYNGSRHSINETFENGCESICVCDATEHVSCTPRCARDIGNLDDSCHLLEHPKDSCCTIASCAEKGQKKSLTSARDLLVILEQVKVVNSSQINLGFVVRLIEPPIAAQVWLSPQADLSWTKRKYKLTPSTGGYLLDVTGLHANTAYLMKVVVGKIESNTIRVKTLDGRISTVVEGCLHANRTYQLSDNFNIGCDQKCVCVQNGVIECQSRCDMYVDAIGYEHCSWIESPDDSCCKIPSCNPDHKIEPTFSFPHFNITCNDDNGNKYKVGETFYKECHERCICQVNGKPLCRPIDCHVSNCTQFDVISADFIPKAPNCCPPIKCINDNSCVYKGENFKNFQQIPQRLIERCDERCVCIEGAIQCVPRCAPPNSSPPPTLPCPPSLAYRGYLPGDNCCTHWMCRDTDSQLKNVRVTPLNATAVRVNFGLPKMLIGQHGNVEVHFSTELEKDRDEWEIRRFSRPSDKAFDAAVLQFDVTGLRPSSSYVFQVLVNIDGMHEKIKSGIISSETPTEQPALLRFDIDLELTARDSKIIVQWRPLSTEEKNTIDGIRVVYRRVNSPVGLWKKSELLHRDITSYEIEKVQPNTKYSVDIEFVPRGNVRIIAEKPAEILTPGDVFSFKITLSPERISSEAASVLLSGVPSPISQYITVVRLSRVSSSQPQKEETFQELREAKVYLDGLQPQTSYKVWVNAYLKNGGEISSNILEFRTPKTSPLPTAGDFTKKTMPVLIIIVVIGVIALIVFGYACNYLQLRRQKHASDLAAYDNPSYKVEMTTMNNNSGHNHSGSPFSFAFL